LTILRRVREWCTEFNVLFKLNTVVNRFNVDENMQEIVNEINPIRLIHWKRLNG
jgi:radical S-adenosyl methionine domain-containing protein 2